MTETTWSQYRNSDFMSLLFLSSLLDALPSPPTKLEVRKTPVKTFPPHVSPRQLASFPHASVGPGSAGSINSC